MRERVWVDELLAWLTVCELSEEAIKRAAEVKAEALTREFPCQTLTCS